MRDKLSPHTEYLLNCAIMGRDPYPDSRHQEKMEMWDEVEVVGARHAKGRKALPKLINAEDVPPQFPANEDGHYNDYDGHEDVNDDDHHNQNKKEE